MTRPIRGFFWLSVAMFLLFAVATTYCVSYGVSCWAGVVMMLYWLILAWGHSQTDE